jgi:hypothetical protein
LLAARCVRTLHAIRGPLRLTKSPLLLLQQQGRCNQQQ